MVSKSLYIIAGCNGSGKTTATFTLLPEIILCKEFINADEIARGLSPFMPEKVSFEAGRIMLERINELLDKNETFAFETTLSTRSYISKILLAKEKGYTVTLIFFWLQSVPLAIERVKIRVSEGGHNIPNDLIERRYKRGIYNFFNLYQDTVDGYLVFNNSGDKPILIAQKSTDSGLEIFSNESFEMFKNSI